MSITNFPEYEPQYRPTDGGGLPRERTRYYPDGGPFTIPGDPDVGVPVGLEAVFEYRGLLLNVQQNVDRYRITSIDGLYDADIRDTRDANPGHDGETPYNSFYGGRTLTLSGTIETYTFPKLREMQFAIRQAFADLNHEYPLHFKTGDFNRDHIIYCKKIGAISGTEVQADSRVTRDFQISLRASNPRFMSYYMNSIDVHMWLTSTPQLIGVANNRGNYSAQPVFRVWGPLGATTFISDTTGHSFTLTGQVQQGDYLDFDTSFPPSVKDSVGQNQWNVLSDDSQPIFFPPGDTAIMATGIAPRVQIFWRDSWI